ncbi:MBL fold metallo-hydrolase [Sphingobium sp. AS12]|uniref:MBL fold metallo-hydrolase n=1 Tax=Sphingobium sp. AS12 TaxID=2849495 RepID=UPI001C3125DF|nr:MBL fold metallo-hydrolase [Sphingobium sp. AS12]MBV2149091.1 MBL fold metallo-hydrolase [Sphingobium sp. AS12]
MRRFELDEISVAALWDEPTGSWQYIVIDRATNHAAIIDPVLDFDPMSGATATRNADALLAFVKEQQVTVDWILDTHPHADHFSSAPYLADALGIPRAIGANVVEVQKLWRDIYCLQDFPTDGSQWDRLFGDGDSFMIGETEMRVLFSPGHTLASITYATDGAAFVHDTLMMPDMGTSRADFPGGSSLSLYRSIERLLALPDDTALFVGHDYEKDDRDVQCCATVAEHKAKNVHVGGDRSEVDFVKLRDTRDATLPLPKLMLAALQVNIRGGRLPDPEPCGRAFLKIPLNHFKPPENEAK